MICKYPELFIYFPYSFLVFFFYSRLFLLSTLTHILSYLSPAGHEGVGGSTGVRGRGPGLQGAEGQAEGKPPGVEGGKPAPNDAVNLERRVGLLSGVALIVGTMIGESRFFDSCL